MRRSLFWTLMTRGNGSKSGVMIYIQARHFQNVGVEDRAISMWVGVEASNGRVSADIRHLSRVRTSRAERNRSVDGCMTAVWDSSLV